MPATHPVRLLVLVALAATLTACNGGQNPNAEGNGGGTAPADVATGRAAPETTAAAGMTPAAGDAPTSAAGGDGAADGATPQGTTDGAPTPTSAAAARATQLAAEKLPSPLMTFGDQGVEPGQIWLPSDVAVAPDGSLYVSDSKGVQRFSAEGEFLTRIGGDDLRIAEGMAVAPDGTLYVTGFGAQVLAFDADGQPAGTLGEAGEGPGTLTKPVDVALDADGNLYVADAAGGRVVVLAPDGSHVTDIGEPGGERGQLSSPRSVAVGPDGTVYVGLGDNFLIQRFGADGSYRDAFGQSYADENIWRTGGLSVADDVLYSTQVLGHVVRAFDLSGERPTMRWEMGGIGTRPTEFSSPVGLDVADGKLYVADQANHRVSVFELND